MVCLTFPFFPEIGARGHSAIRERKMGFLGCFPKSINAIEASNDKACRRFPRFPKCPETGTPDFPAIPAAAIEAAGTITGREKGKGRDRCELMRNTNLHLMGVRTLANRKTVGELEQAHPFMCRSSDLI